MSVPSLRAKRLADLYELAQDKGLKRNKAFWEAYRALPQRDQETLENALVAASRAARNFIEADEPPDGISEALKDLRKRRWR
jgi:hypothetical protein